MNTLFNRFLFGPAYGWGKHFQAQLPDPLEVVHKLRPDKVAWTSILWSFLLALVILLIGGAILYWTAHRKTAELRFQTIESNPKAKVSEVFASVRWRFEGWFALHLLLSSGCGWLCWYVLNN